MPFVIKMKEGSLIPITILKFSLMCTWQIPYIFRFHSRYFPLSSWIARLHQTTNMNLHFYFLYLFLIFLCIFWYTEINFPLPVTTWCKIYYLWCLLSKELEIIKRFSMLASVMYYPLFFYLNHFHSTVCS